MKKEINVIVNGYICDEALNDYYVQLWRILRDLYGDDILAEISKMYDEEIQ